MSDQPSQPKLLVITHRVPYPPTRGDRIRNWRLIEQLSQHFQVYLACPASRPISLEEWNAIDQHVTGFLTEPIRSPIRFIYRCARTLRWVLYNRSITEGLFYSNLLNEKMIEWQQHHQFDAVYGVCSSVWPYVKSLDIPVKIMDLMDVDSLKFQAYARHSQPVFSSLYHLEARRLKLVEMEIAKQTQFMTITTEQEARLFRSFCEFGKLIVIENGVTLDANPDNHELPCELQPYLKATDKAAPPVLLFVGALDYKPNIEAVLWYAQHIWPKVHRERPDAVFRIIGRDPVPQLKKLSKSPGIQFIGPVDKVTPHLVHCTAVIVPLRLARGIQNKVLEGMAAGKAVITSPSAAEGIHAQDKRDLAIAHKKEEWIHLSLKALDDASWCEQLGSNGQQFIQQHHDWAATAKPLIHAIQDAIALKTQASKGESSATDFNQSPKALWPK